MEKEIKLYQFEVDFSGNVIPLPIGRLALAKNSVVRMCLDSEGLKLVIPKRAKNNGEIIWLEEVEYEGHPGLGLPIKKNDQTRSP